MNIRESGFNSEKNVESDVARPTVAAARRVVVKLGTRVLTHDVGGLALARMFGIVEAVARERARREFLIVSSGAVELGRELLGLDEIPTGIELRQACAAVGQTRLMALYQDGFSQFGLRCGQVLLTQGDFDDRARYLNLRRTLNTLLERGVVPIVNENDAVATEELKLHSGDGRAVFGDNDRLSALVAAKLDSDLLVLLTDVQGLYHQGPRRHEEARLLSRVEESDAVTAGAAGSGAGRGGMRSKVEAATVAARGGCGVVIASGREPNALERVLRGEEIGTWFPERETLDDSQSWIAFASASRGTLHLAGGAVEALRNQGAGLLAAGVSKVVGAFHAGDVVELRGPDGTTVGRGRIAWDSEAVRAWCKQQSPSGLNPSLIRRDDFVPEG